MDTSQQIIYWICHASSVLYVGWVVGSFDELGQSARVFLVFVLSLVLGVAIGTLNVMGAL